MPEPNAETTRSVGDRSQPNARFTCRRGRSTHDTRPRGRARSFYPGAASGRDHIAGEIEMTREQIDMARREYNAAINATIAVHDIAPALTPPWFALSELARIALDANAKALGVVN